MTEQENDLRHTRAEDALALLSGTSLVALAVSLLQQGHLLSGGTAGLAFLVHYHTGWGFGIVYFVLNLPFYAVAWRHLDHAFLLKTLLAVALMSVLAEFTPQWIGYAHLSPLYAALMGGMLLGVGFLILFRHRASLGGVGILAFWLQESRGWRAGHLQMAVDGVVLALALATVPLGQVAYSVLGALVLNLILSINHRRGRYLAT
jgi:uncharacterized membrane-anchored protein YitT (DUF2179 family)